MNYTEELKRLVAMMGYEWKQTPRSYARILWYLFQTLLCAGAVIVITIWNLLNTMADEMEKGQKGQKKKPPRQKPTLDIPVEISEKCPFGITKYCTHKCHYWVKTFDGGGYCTKYTAKKVW